MQGGRAVSDRQCMARTDQSGEIGLKRGRHLAHRQPAAPHHVQDGRFFFRPQLDVGERDAPDRFDRFHDYHPGTA